MLKVTDSRQVQAVVLALELTDRKLRNELNRRGKAALDPLWKSAVAAQAVTATDRAVIVKGARVAGGNPPTAIAASSTRKLAGGLVPAKDWPVIEFGAIARNKVTRYQSTSRKGRSYQVSRHTARQLPQHNKSGRVAYAALAKVAPRIVSVWVGTIYEGYREAFRG